MNDKMIFKINATWFKFLSYYTEQKYKHNTFRKPVSIWCDHHLPSPPHRVDQVVYCGLWNVGPLLFNGCAKLLDIGRNWNTLSYTPIQSIPNMLNGWHVRWVCWPCKNWDVFSFQELCTDPCNMGPCIIMLQHEVMVVDEWHNNGPQDLVTVSLCIQNAINKMHLCSLSITYACPYHNPTATMGHSIHNADISKPLTHTTPYTLSAICPVQWKPGFIREENTSPKCQTPSNVNICPLKSVTTTNCSQVETPMRTTSMQMSFPETVSDSLCRNSLVTQTDCCSSCPGGWTQTILEVKMLDVEVLGWCGYTWSAVVRPVGCTTKFSEMPLETAYGREMNIQSTGNSSGGHSCSQHANCTLPATSVALCCVIKPHILEWPFIVASLRHTCAIIMLSNQHLDMPHLWGGWIISAKEKCSLTQI